MSKVKQTFTYKFPRAGVTCDCVVFYRRGSRLQTLLIQRASDPFVGKWAIPGGFMDMNETLEQCAIRELREETGVHILSLDFVGIYDAVNRDPRDRIISAAFMKVIRLKQSAFAGDDAEHAAWFDCEDLPPLAFDHKRIIKDALKKLNQGK